MTKNRALSLLFIGFVAMWSIYLCVMFSRMEDSRFWELYRYIQLMEGVAR